MIWFQTSHFMRTGGRYAFPWDVNLILTKLGMKESCAVSICNNNKYILVAKFDTIGSLKLYFISPDFQGEFWLWQELHLTVKRWMFGCPIICCGTKVSHGLFKSKWGKPVSTDLAQWTSDVQYFHENIKMNNCRFHQNWLITMTRRWTRKLWFESKYNERFCSLCRVQGIWTVGFTWMQLKGVIDGLSSAIRSCPTFKECWGWFQGCEPLRSGMEIQKTERFEGDSRRRMTQIHSDRERNGVCTEIETVSMETWNRVGNFMCITIVDCVTSEGLFLHDMNGENKWDLTKVKNMALEEVRNMWIVRKRSLENWRPQKKAGRDKVSEIANALRQRWARRQINDECVDQKKKLT